MADHLKSGYNGIEAVVNDVRSRSGAALVARSVLRFQTAGGVECRRTVGERMSTRTYDNLGFPVPIDFGSVATDRGPTTDGTASKPPGRRGVSFSKRLVVVAVLLLGVIPLAVGPSLLPEIRLAVVRWSLERAGRFEVRDESAAAVAELDRAIGWYGEDADLLCLRAGLRMENRDPGGARRDLCRAIELAPLAVEPFRIRAIVHASLGDADAAVADADTVCDRSGEADPQGINLRSYVRALVGRDLSEALDDIDGVIATLGDPPPEYVDTRGFLLQRLGRNAEALRDLDEAISRMRDTRRRVTLLAGRIGGVDLARRLRTADHALAVMIHHRALALESLGREAEAEADFTLAARKGYDPGRGIF